MKNMRQLDAHRVVIGSRKCHGAMYSEAPLRFRFRANPIHIAKSLCVKMVAASTQACAF
jgi:hypothetical protein